MKMLLVINNFLNDITTTEDGFFIGHIDSADNYNQFLTALKDAGYYFSVRDSERFKEDGQFLFKCNKSIVPVPFSGCPFRRERNITYQCAFGSQYYGKLKKQGSSDIVLGKSDKKTSRARISKKLGCKAKMAAKCIRIYVDYKIPSESSHWRMKKEVISSLKHDLMSKDCEVKSLSRYFVKISVADQHCHGPMHPRGVIRKFLEATKCKGPALAAEEEEAFVTSNVEEGDVTFETVCVVEQEGGLVDLRELCRQKGKEVATLSQHLCNDEGQLRDLLAALTHVTDRLNESQLAGSVEVACGGEDLLISDTIIMDDQLCFPSDVSQTVVVEGEDVGQVQGFTEDGSLEIERGIYLSGDLMKLEMERTEEGIAELGERPLSKITQSRRLQKRILATPGIAQSFQKRFDSSVIEPPAGLELQGSNLDEGRVIYYVLE